MIHYAVSLGCFGQQVTPALAEALRKSKFQKAELSFTPYTDPESDASKQTLALTKELLAEGSLQSASVHLPFYGNGLCWDPSALDEEVRHGVVGRFAQIIRDNAELMAPLATLHASNEPPMAEHPQRLDQACKTIEELLPVAEEFNFSFNVEFLPRTCIGDCVEELQAIMARFDSKHVGICFDVNHIMARYKQLPEMISTLAPRIRSFHISDYDGFDETHWLPGQGIIDWPAVMKAIRAIDHDVLLILETTYQLGGKHHNHDIDPYFAVRENEVACWFMQNCERIIDENKKFVIP